jgi:phospholipase C
MKVPFNRRAALKALGAAAVTPLLPACSGGPGPGAGGSGELTAELLRERIDTVVVLMMENRSFDHYLGALSLLEGRDDVDGLQDGMSNPHPEGGDVPIQPADADCIADPPHGWSSSHDQFANGENSGFVAEHYQRHGASEAHRVMGYLDRQSLPTFYALADAGTICDRWFCSLMTSTWPNRFYSLGAQSGGARSNEATDDWDWPDIFDRVAASGRSWTNYYGNVPFAMLLPNRTLAESNFLPIEEFFRNAEHGTLPSLVWLDPVYGRNDDHPPCHPLAGQVFVSSIYEALAQSPQWQRTLFIVSYDEHGGFFDHVPPPTAADDREGEGFEQLGFRVPALVGGPWVKQGYVSSEIYDHSSVLAFIERLWDLDPLTDRDAGANDLMDVLDVQRLLDEEPASPATLPTIEASDDELYAPECVYDVGRRSPADSRRPLTGQPELEALLDGPLAGSPFDRREQTDRIYEDLLREAERLGVLSRRH